MDETSPIAGTSVTELHNLEVKMSTKVDTSNYAPSRTKSVEDEWIELIIEAKRLGVSIEEIRQFLEESSRGKL
jgi:DNA-binding transcriptional regulator YhcF (GntR family)